MRGIRDEVVRASENRDVEYEISDKGVEDNGLVRYNEERRECYRKKDEEQTHFPLRNCPSLRNHSPLRNRSFPLRSTESFFAL